MPSFYNLFGAEGVDLPLEFFRKRAIGEISKEVGNRLLAEGYEVNGYRLTGDNYF